MEGLRQIRGKLEHSFFVLLVSGGGFDSSNCDKQRWEKRGKTRKGRIHVIHCGGVFAAVATIGRKWCSLPKVAPPPPFSTLASSQFKSTKTSCKNFDQQLIKMSLLSYQSSVIVEHYKVLRTKFKACIEFERPVNCTIFSQSVAILSDSTGLIMTLP